MVSRWRRDPVAFVREVLVDPESGQPFVLYAAQERFLRHALTVGANGRLPFAELVYACPKKSGKTAAAAMAALYAIVVLGGRYAEGFCVANDLEQAQGRVFAAIVRIIQSSPLLRDAAKITGSRVEFTSTGASITALASDYAGAAGANPTIVCFDELWAYISERSRRLWDELVPVPTRKVSVRLTTTYAGFEGESELLEDLYRRGMKGRRIAPALYRQRGLLMFWSHKPVAPWQTAAWLAQMRAQLRPNAFLRMIENRFVTSESTFVEPEWWTACEDVALHPMVANATVPVFVGVDASVKRDATAIVACTWDAEAKRVRLVWHRVFQPTPREPLDFETTIEQSLLDLRDRFAVRRVPFDPFQLLAVAQRLTQAGVPMVEFPQSVPNLTAASTNLYELVKGGNLHVYVDEGLRLAVHRAV